MRKPNPIQLSGDRIPAVTASNFRAEGQHALVDVTIVKFRLKVRDCKFHRARKRLSLPASIEFLDDADKHRFEAAAIAAAMLLLGDAR